MPGIFAFHSPIPEPELGLVADRLLADMRLFPWQKGRAWAVAGGKVRLGVVVNAHDGDPLDRFGAQEGPLTCVVDGTVVRSREECGAEPLLAGQRYAQAVLAAYRAFGSGFASRLEGQYSVAIHDARTETVVVACDRHGLAPLFRWHGDEAWAYGSLLGPLAKSGLLPVQMDPEALVTLLKYKQLFCRQSLIRGVEIFDPATAEIHDLASGSTEKERYWHYGHMGGKAAGPSFAKRMDAVCDAFIAATDRSVSRPGPYSIGLSGGMDSRLVAGLALGKADGFFSWTYGTDDASDLRIARILAEKMGIPHDHVPVELDATARHATDLATTTNGGRPLLDASQLERCHALLGKSNVHLSGYRGGLILGDTVMDIGVPHAARYARFRLGRGPRVSHPWLDALKTDEELALFYRDVGPGASRTGASLVPDADFDIEKQASRMMSSDLAEVPAEYKLEQFTEEFGGGRHATLLGILYDRHFYGDASVFYDYEVRDLCQSLPVAWRRNRRAYITAFRRLIPDLAAVEYANTGLPATMPHWRVGATKFLRRILKRDLPLSVGTDIQGWSRHPHVEGLLAEILTDPRTQQRPWWDGNLISSVFADHRTGRTSAAGELGTVATVELFARRWLDG